MPPPFRAATSSTLCFLLLLVTWAGPALAQAEIGIGASVTEDNETTAVAAASWLPGIRDLTNATLRAEVGGIYVRGRDGTPGQDLDDDVLVAFAGLRYERTDNGLVLGAGVGAQTGETDALSGDLQFVSSLGWRWPRLTVLVRHVSNAGLDETNGGETMLLVNGRF